MRRLFAWVRLWGDRRAAARLVRWTGGGGYHRHARKMRESYWRSFRREVEQWLIEWNPSAQTLVLVGPSAGYCLPDSFLARFEKLIAFDLDPEAEPRFRALHPAVSESGRLSWRRGDALGLIEGSSDSCELLREVRRQEGSVAVLFCNVLGQARFHWEDPEEDPGFKDWTARMQVFLTKIPVWASFHDRFSGQLRPMEARWNLKTSPALQGGWSRFLSGAVQPGCEDRELLDHLTDTFIPEDSSRVILRWEFAPGVFHWIEGVCSPSCRDKTPMI